MTTTAIAEGERAHIRTVLVAGGGDVGSAVAHLLFRHRLRVLLVERPRSAHARRGMAFTDVLFDGTAHLEGVQARLLPDPGSLAACWSAGEVLPVMTMPEAQLLAAHPFDVLVEATMRRHHAPGDLRALAPLAIGLGPGYAPGRNCHVAIETRWGDDMGAILRQGAAAARGGGPRALDGVTRERFGIAPVDGIWRSPACLGQAVVAGEVLGHLGSHEIVAPIRGTLRGLARDGVEVMAGQRLLEVDPRAAPQVHGIGERPAAIARGVAAVLGLAPVACSGSLP